ncbi:MAG: S-layer homology domain-containing protein [Candidatus Saganbacteria bacterium]|nr:S-layer homology domain-containing protein [Candidatus Saganbacteria bacterium]
MMKSLFVIIFVFSIFIAPVIAEAETLGIPKGHWALSSVEEMVKMGVMSGYPDGTFRGNQKITRYETAASLDRLAKILKEKIAALKKEKFIARHSGEKWFEGSFLSELRLGNLFTQKGGIFGGIANYRLKLSKNLNIGREANMIINFDTMDYGYMDDGATITDGLLATKLLDIETNMKVGGIDLKLTYGPGPKTHEADPAGISPSELGVTYIRPYTGFQASGTINDLYLSGGLIALGHPASGRIQTSQLTASVMKSIYNIALLKKLDIVLMADYVSSGILGSSPKDIRGAIAMRATLSNKTEAVWGIGLGGTKQSNWLVGAELEMDDLFGSELNASIQVYKIGSQFITSEFAAEEMFFAGFDNFMRPLENGTANIGAKASKSLTKKLKIEGKGDIRLNGDYKLESPKGRITLEGGLEYALSASSTLKGRYRINQDKAFGGTSDLFILGVLNTF